MPAMCTPDFAPALEWTHADLAAIFDRSFEGYYAPVSTTARSLEQRVRTEHIDLASSYVAMAGGSPAGLALIARRGRTSRVAAMGLVPAWRSKGLGRTLMQRVLDEARGRGDARMILEVIDANHAARALYEKVGFRARRKLVGYTATEGPATAHTPAPMDTAVVARRLVQWDIAGAPDLPWQMAPETLAGMTAPASGHALDDAAVAVVTEAPKGVLLWTLAVRPDARGQGLGTRLVQGLRARFPGKPLRIIPILPEGLGEAFLARNGFARDALGQLEMASPLADAEA